jgi:V/A-type H+-transporting ATPase subunit D
VTQRINLFEKVLIPEAKENLRKIGIFLSDTERTAVCRSKLAKAKLEKAFATSQISRSNDLSASSSEEI